MTIKPGAANKKPRPGRLRIVAGKWRSRLLDIAELPGLRPTSERIRETLFNWLAPSIQGARCLDLFAGSGALSFEAASRAAAHITCVELNPVSAASIKENIAILEANTISLLQQDALKFLTTSSPEKKYDLIFLDPPFSENLLEKSCELLENNAWLNDSALIYLESDQDLGEYALPSNWTLVKQKKAGQVYYGLCQKFK